MGTIIRKRKLFWVWQWQKEENWINAMAAKGLLLTEVGFCRYEFEEGEPGAYQYCMQMLKGAAWGFAAASLFYRVREMKGELVLRE